jgi:PKD repeat protein
MTGSNGREGEQATFNATIAGSEPLTFRWGFGLGASPSVVNEEVAVVTFRNPGVYLGTLTVTNGCGSDEFEFEYRVTSAGQFAAYDNAFIGTYHVETNHPTAGECVFDVTVRVNFDDFDRDGTPDSFRASRVDGGGSIFCSGMGMGGNLVAAPNSFTWTTSLVENSVGTGSIDDRSLTIVGTGSRTFVDGVQSISVRIDATSEFP